MTRSRTRILGAALAVLVAAGLMVGLTTGPASAHSINHSVNLSGNMAILDDESWPFSDERGNRGFNNNVIVGRNLSTAVSTATGCVGGEVRAEIRFTVIDNETFPGWIQVDPLIRLFEGTSCSSGDLDGTTDPPWFWVGPNSSVSQTFRVSNTDEGGDRADITYNVVNSTTV